MEVPEIRNGCGQIVWTRRLYQMVSSGQIPMIRLPFPYLSVQTLVKCSGTFFWIIATETPVTSHFFDKLWKQGFRDAGRVKW